MRVRCKDGALTRVESSDTPRGEVNSLWCRANDESPWEFELMLDDSVGDNWAYRRAPTITRPLASAIRRNGQGVPYLAPEIQLLYKSRAPRPKDEADFARTAPCLVSTARAWLVEALVRIEPGHPWLDAIAGLDS